MRKKFTLLFFIAMFSLGFAADASLNIYAVYDPSKVGEVAMVTAIANEIALTHPAAQITKKPNATFGDLDLDYPSVIITAGQFGINFIKSGTIPTHVKVLLCTHQCFDYMNDLHDVYITMPEHAITESIKNFAQTNNLTLIPTLGVLHTMSGKALASEDASVIHLTDAKIGLILGGDAETLEGGWKVFSVENAQRLANEIAKFQKRTGDKILITNGPRTGRSAIAHKTDGLDVVSTAFLNALREAGLKEGTDFEFFNFQFSRPSALKAVMKVVLNNKGFMIVPGESTSSISEILAVMPAAIYEHDAMNEQHRAFVEKLTRSRSAVLWSHVPDATLMYAYVPLAAQADKVVADFLK
jgi:mitochondrial fission protein ELM1